MSDATRRTERVPILGALQGEIMVFQPMLIRDIATAGVTVETRFPLHLDSLHEVRMTLGRVSIVLKGRVVHSRISDVDQDIVSYLSGLEFVEVPARSLEAIQEFLAGVKADRHGG
jgi:hypothetical protein